MKNKITTFILLLLLVLLASCGSKKELVEVPVVVEKPVLHVEHSTDTVLQRDSITVYQKGDTIYHESFQTLHHHHYHSTTDTVTSIVEVPITVTKEVEKSLSTWQKTRMRAGDFMLALLICAAGFGALHIFRKIKRL
jgi:hypothetical protein